MEDVVDRIPSGGRQLKAGAVLNYAIILLNNVIGLVYTPYMLRMLGESEFGIYSMMASVIAYLTVLDFGFANAVVRYTSKFRSQGREREQYEMFGMFIVIYSVVAVLAVACGMALYCNMDNIFGAKMTAQEIAKAKPMLLLLLFNLAVTFPMSVFGSVITAYEQFIFQKVLVILRVLLSTLAMTAMLYAGYKAMGLVIVQTLFNVLLLTANCIFCIRHLKIKISFGGFRWGFFKEVSLYSFWILLNTIMDRIYWSTGQFILGAVSGTAAVALFGVAVKLEQMYMSFSTAISSVFLPKVTAMVTAGNDSKEISDLFIRTGRIQYAVLIFILSGFVIFGKPFLELWAPGYEGAYRITLIFFVPLTVPLIQNLGITILQARNRMKFRSVVYLVIALLSLVFQIILSKRFGAEGCAWAVSAGLVLGQIIIMNIYYKVSQGIDIGHFWMEILKMTIVPAVLAAVGWFAVRNLDLSGVVRLIFAIAAYSAVYLPLFWRFSMNDYERRLVTKLFSRNGKNKE